MKIYVLNRSNLILTVHANPSDTVLELKNDSLVGDYIKADG